MLHGVYKKATTCAHIRTRSTPEESLALPTMLLAFCAEGFALSLEPVRTYYSGLRKWSE